MQNDDTQGQGGGGGTPQWDQPATPATDDPASPTPAEPVGETPVEPTTPEPAPMPETGDTGGVPTDGAPAVDQPTDGDQGSESGPSPV